MHIHTHIHDSHSHACTHAYMHTYQTDPDDVREMLSELQQEATAEAGVAPMLVQRNQAGGEDTRTPIPVHMRSNTLLIDTEKIETNKRKQALLIGINEDSGNSLASGLRPRDLEIKVGWMHKLGRINKSWRRRFFVAAHGQLEYYTGPDRVEKKGTMALVQVRVVPIDAGVFKPPSEFCLEVSHHVSDRRLVLACDGAEEQEAWRRALQRGGIGSVQELPPGLMLASDLGSGGSGSGIYGGSAAADAAAAANTRDAAGEAKDGGAATPSSKLPFYGMHISDPNTLRVIETADWAGFITKRGRINKTWNMRLFVLKGPLLTYYAADHKPIKIESRKGAMSVAGAQVEKCIRLDGQPGIDIVAADADTKGNPRRLMLKFPGGADTSTLSVWVEKLSHAASRFSGHLTNEEREVVTAFADSKPAHCASCTKSFSLFRKSYQCPACGLAFCKACSSKRLPLPEITGTSEVLRVCDSCYAIESGRLIATQAQAKRQREENERVVRRREVMETLFWWYEDAESGARQGPFESSRMLAWFDAGYFAPDLKLWWGQHRDGRNAFRRRVRTLEALFPGNNETFALAFADAVEEANWVESTDPASHKTYYYNINTEVSAWTLPTVSGDNAAEADSIEGAGGTVKAGDAVHQYDYERCDKWYFKDHSQTTQGPFHADEMRAWMDAGYFTSALYARLGDHGPFRLLQSLYSDLSLAFTCPPGQSTQAISQWAAAATADEGAEEGGAAKMDNTTDGDNEYVGSTPLDKEHSSSERKIQSSTAVVQQLAARARSDTANSLMRSQAASAKVSSSQKSLVSSESNSSEAVIHRKGFLYKRGRVNTGWRKRFFVLDDVCLSYFAKEGGKKKGAMKMTGIRIEKYETRSKSGDTEFRLDVIASDRKLMLKAASVEDQVRWAVSIERVSHASDLAATVVPLPSGQRPSSIKITHRGRSATEGETLLLGSLSTPRTPSESMLRQGFSAVKKGNQRSCKPSTPLGKYRQWSDSMRSVHFDEDRSGTGFAESADHEPVGEEAAAADEGRHTSLSRNKAVPRDMLRHMNRGHCDVDLELIKAYGADTTKSNAEHSLLLSCIGSTSHPDLVKLNIFSRLDQDALGALVDVMFKIPTYPGMQVIREGDAGDLFYIVGGGTFDVTVGYSTNHRRSQEIRGQVPRKNSNLSRLMRISTGDDRKYLTEQEDATDETVFCTTLEVGSCFGEGALLSATRPTTVTCSTGTKGTAGHTTTASGSAKAGDGENEGGWLWALRRDAYQTAVRTFEQRKKRERLAFLRSVPLFSGGTLTGKDYSRLSDAVESRTFTASSTIVAKGAPKKKLYIVKTGTARAIEANGQIWSAGDTFGNRALLYEENWDVAVVADHDIECLVLERKEFNQLLGGLKERILKTWKREHRRSVIDSKEAVEDDHEEGGGGEEGKSTELARSTHDPLLAMRGTITARHLKQDSEESIGRVYRDAAHSVDVVLARMSTENTETALSHMSSEEIEEVLNTSGLRMSSEFIATAMQGPDDGGQQQSDAQDAESNYDDPSDDDDDEEDEDDDEDDEEWDYEEEQHIEWEEGEMLDATIRFEDLEPRALLGAGSFGSVKLVLHKPTQRHYALKCMRRVYVVDNGWEDMVENEKSAMCELAGRSVFLVNLYNTFSDQVNIYMLMELCTGGELYDHLCKQKDKCVSVGAARFCKLF